MARMTRAFTLALALWLGSALAGAPAAAQTSGEGLRLTLEPGEAALVLGEPAYATVTLYNAGSEAVTILPDLTLTSGFVEIRVDPPEGEAFEFTPLAVDDVEVARAELAPGDEIAEVVQVFFGGRGWTFDRPGSYTLTATYRVPGGTQVRSEPATVNVAEGDSAGRSLLSAQPETLRQTGKFLVWQQGDHLRRALARLEEIVERYPDSQVADYARLAMGINLSESFYDYTAGGVRKARPAEALRWLEGVRETSLPPVQRLRLHMALSRSYAALGRQAEAAAALGRARELAADRPALETLLEEGTTDGER